MKDWFIRQTRRAYSPAARLLALIPAAMLFVGALPLLLVILGRALDGRLGLPAVFWQPVNWIAGLLLLAIGVPLAMWTIIVQFSIGRGTPIPLMATQKLIIQPPYTLCRNPMALGTILAYLGVAVIIGSLAAAGLVMLSALALLLYIRRFEEMEMEERFGAEYVAYRQRTPFLIPRLTGK